MGPRVAAARILARLAQGGHSLGELLAPHRKLPEYGLLQEICYGVCRHRKPLAFLLAQLLERPLRKRDGEIEFLLLGSLYQLRELAVPDYAVINEAVKAAGPLRKTRAKPLINAVLRSFQRRRAELEEQLSRQEEPLRTSHPLWLHRAIAIDWPRQRQAILAANNQRPPMCLRVNRRRRSREEFMTTLRQGGIECEPGLLAPTAVYLRKPRPVREIPGFAEGLASVQDEAAQLAVELLRPAAGERLLDACAAPGGKTGHLLECEPRLAGCVALDRDRARSTKIAENLDRLGLAAEIAVADASLPETWWDGGLFDAILLDAPCSATGVIRRHPDSKWLLRAADIAAHSERQGKLLRGVWCCLKPGGRLLYTTCSLLRAENEQVVASFLAAAPDAKAASIESVWGIECAHGKQLLPSAAGETATAEKTPAGPDGFYFCLLNKV